MARSTCKKCGVVIFNDFSSSGSWYYLDKRWRPWKCYKGENHQPERSYGTAVLSMDESGAPDFNQDLWWDRRPHPSDSPYEVMVNEADEELHYQFGLHEFGPRYGMQKLALDLSLANRRIVDELRRQGTEVEIDGPRPKTITYNDKKYYEPEYARANNLAAYAEFDPRHLDKSRVYSRHYLLPKELVAAIEAGGEATAPPIRSKVLRIALHILGRYPCSGCKRWFKSSQWISWHGREPTADLVWSGPLCRDCFKKAQKDSNASG